MTACIICSTATTFPGHTLTLYTLPKAPSPSSPTICHFSIGSTSRVMLGYSFRPFFFTPENSARRNDIFTFDYSSSGEMQRSSGRFTSRLVFTSSSRFARFAIVYNKWVWTQLGQRPCVGVSSDSFVHD